MMMNYFKKQEQLTMADLLLIDFYYKCINLHHQHEQVESILSHQTLTMLNIHVYLCIYKEIKQMPTQQTHMNLTLTISMLIMEVEVI